MEAEEYQAFIKRLAKQYDNMLWYGKEIQAEIDFQEKKLQLLKDAVDSAQVKTGIRIMESVVERVQMVPRKDEPDIIPDKAKEIQSYINKLQTRYDQMLDYREDIVEEVVSQEKKLAETKKTVSAKKTKLNDDISRTRQELDDIKSEKADFVAHCNGWEKRLQTKEKENNRRTLELDQREADIRDSVASMAKTQTEIEREKREVEQVRKNWENIEAKAEKTFQRANTLLERNKAKESHLNELQRVSDNEITSKQLSLKHSSSILSLKEEELAKTKKELEKKEKELDNEKQHLSSQQQAFRLAVMEAKRKWQM